MSNRVIGVVASIVAMFYVGGTIASAQGRHRTDQKIGHTIMFEKPTVMGPGRGFTRRLDSQQHAGPGSRFVFSPDGKYLASVLSEWFPAGIDLKTGKKLAAPKGRVLLWNLEDAKVERTWMHDHGNRSRLGQRWRWVSGEVGFDRGCQPCKSMA